MKVYKNKRKHLMENPLPLISKQISSSLILYLEALDVVSRLAERIGSRVNGFVAHIINSFEAHTQFDKHRSLKGFFSEMGRIRKFALLS